ncbi:MAG: serine protease [Candidatus Omnitrophica bacterium]|nr:serine protease [Candidatus Omnitrophota bacterium]
MFVRGIKIAKNSMFPIFRFEQINAIQSNVFTVGSGFFINKRGYFVSVAHVFDNPNNQTSFHYWGQIPDRVHNPAIKIVEISRDDENDIFVGKIEIQSPHHFYIAKQLPDIGRSICVSGYPLATIQNNPQGGLDLSGVRRYFQPSFVLDYIICNSSNPHGKIRKHNGFLVRDLGLYGMSGGPVFNTSGVVFGMQGSITQPRTSSGGPGCSITVQNAVAIRSSLIINLLEKTRIKYNILAKF